MFGRAITIRILSPVSPLSVPKAARLGRGNAFPYVFDTENEDRVLGPEKSGLRWANPASNAGERAAKKQEENSP